MQAFGRTTGDFQRIVYIFTNFFVYISRSTNGVIVKCETCTFMGDTTDV